jgi:hypothetical protein
MAVRASLTIVMKMQINRQPVMTEPPRLQQRNDKKELDYA